MSYELKYSYTNLHIDLNVALRSPSAKTVGNTLACSMDCAGFLTHYFKDPVIVGLILFV